MLADCRLLGKKICFEIDHDDIDIERLKARARRCGAKVLKSSVCPDIIVTSSPTLLCEGVASCICSVEQFRHVLDRAEQLGPIVSATAKKAKTMPRKKKKKAPFASSSKPPSSQEKAAPLQSTEFHSNVPLEPFEIPFLMPLLGPVDFYDNLVKKVTEEKVAADLLEYFRRNVPATSTTATSSTSTQTEQEKFVVVLRSLMMMSDAMRTRFRRFPEVISVDTCSGVKKQRLQYCSLVGMDGGLQSFRISFGLVCGERIVEMKFVHNATRFLASDTSGTPYFQATRLLVSDFAPQITGPHMSLSQELTPTAYAGTERACVASWYVFFGALSLKCCVGIAAMM